MSDKNQLIYTTHSPFLIDNQNLENAIAAYLTETGETKFTRDLGQAGRRTTKKKSIYPVHAAIGLSVANTFLSDASPVFVEGVSDQSLLTGFLAALHREGYFSKTDPVFMPFGGVPSLGPMLAILSATGEKLHPVLLDSDDAGLSKARELRNALYKDNKDRVIEVSAFTKKAKPELEDLLPLELFNEVANLYIDKNGEGLTYVPLQDPNKSFVDHMSGQTVGDWKVDCATIVKGRLRNVGTKIDDQTLKTWLELLKALGVDLRKL